MPFSFVLAGIIFFLTLAWCGVELLAEGMSDAPSQQAVPVWPWFVSGTLIAVVIASSHWWHFKW